MFVDYNTPSVFVYGCGLAGRWLADHFGDRCVGFIDTDEKKSGWCTVPRQCSHP